MPQVLLDIPDIIPEGPIRYTLVVIVLLLLLLYTLASGSFTKDPSGDKNVGD